MTAGSGLSPRVRGNPPWLPDRADLPVELPPREAQRALERERPVCEPEVEVEAERRPLHRAQGVQVDRDRAADDLVKEVLAKLDRGSASRAATSWVTWSSCVKCRGWRRRVGLTVLVGSAVRLRSVGDGIKSAFFLLRARWGHPSRPNFCTGASPSQEHTATAAAPES